MSRDLIKKNVGELKKKERGENLPEKIGDGGNSFFSFRYSYKSVSSFGGKTHVKAKEKRFQNGKLEEEEFEGVMDGNVYEKAAKDMQSNFMKSFSNLLNPFSFLLPGDSDKDRKK